MRVCIDIETNRLIKPDKIWCIVCKDVDTGQFYIFRNVTEDGEEKRKFLEFAKGVDHWIGHNLLGFDYPVLQRLLDFQLDYTPGEITLRATDTLLVSKLVDYSREEGHSIEAYGVQFGYQKIKFSDFSKWSQELEDYCVRDVEICTRVYNYYLHVINGDQWHNSLLLEHTFQGVVNQLHDTGFAFNSSSALKLLGKVEEELEELDTKIEVAFPPKLNLIREITPKATKFGTIALNTIPKNLRSDIVDMTVGAPFSYCVWKEFNPSSHKQLIEVLSKSGWRPVDKTQTHIDTKRERDQLSRKRKKEAGLDIRISLCDNKLQSLERYGWKINENNLSSLPPNAPAPARLLAKRILLESRRRTLTEWLGLVEEDGRIHGQFQGIGAWTHRMSHQKPNTANIPNEFKEDGSKKLLGKEMRALWCAPKKRLLVGVDAEGIQLRLFAHYIEDEEFTNALTNGKKADKTDPHSFNQKVIGDICKTRKAAKRFIFAMLLGGGLDKLAQILECTRDQAQEALDRILQRYTGFAYLKKSVFPKDAARGYFTGLDGRRVQIPDTTESGRRHLCMSGYLQNGEAVVMKRATLKWHDKLKEYDALLVNFVHDEWQVECPNSMDIAVPLAKMMADSLREVGEDLKLNCPLAGSYWNDDKNDYTISTNWSLTH